MQEMKIHDVAKKDAYHAVASPMLYTVINDTHLTPKEQKKKAKSLELQCMPFIWNIHFDWSRKHIWYPVLHKLQQLTIEFSSTHSIRKTSRQILRRLGNSYASLHVRRGDVLGKTEGCDTKVASVVKYVKGELAHLQHMKKKLPKTIVFFTDEDNVDYLASLEHELGHSTRLAVRNGEELIRQELKRQTRISNQETANWIKEMMEDNYYIYSITLILRHDAMYEMARERYCQRLTV